jgi:hypothetical protein
VEKTMKNLALALAFLAGLPLAAAAQVSKEDIKKLAGAGISDDVILSYVKANGPVAKLSAEDVVELKQAGASEKVLTAILAGPAPAPAPTTRVAVDTTPYYYTPTYYSYPSTYVSSCYPTYGGYYPNYTSYYAPRRYYTSGYCAPRSYYYPSVSVGWSSGRYYAPRGSFGVSAYRR